MAIPPGGTAKDEATLPKRATQRPVALRAANGAGGLSQFLDSAPRSALLAAAGTLVIAAVLAVTVISRLDSRESSPETLVLGPTSTAAQSESVLGEGLPAMDAFGEYSPLRDDAHSLEWRIPVSAPIETFPLGAKLNERGNTVDCTDEQRAWLSEWATPAGVMTAGEISAAFCGQLWNNSDSGGAVSLGNIRFEGAEESTEPVVVFFCPNGGGGMGDGTTTIAVGVDGTPAVINGRPTPCTLAEAKQLMSDLASTASR